VAQQVAVVDGAQPEELEGVVRCRIDQGVEGGGVRGDEAGEVGVVSSSFACE
jgi:hypothetical protein